MNKVINYIIPCVSSVFKAEKLLPSSIENHFEKELQTNRYLFQAVVEHSFGAILVTDLKGKISYVNCPLEIFLKTKAFNLTGKKLKVILDKTFPAVENKPPTNTISYMVNNFKEFNGESISLKNFNLPFSKAKVYTRLIYDHLGNIQGIFWFWTNDNYYPSKFMKNIAKLCISAINNNITVIKKCAQVFSSLDWETRVHSHQVIKYASIIADCIGLTEDEKYTLCTAALLHDVGKIKIPKKVLNKQAKLTEEEYQVIKKHPQVGCDLVKDIPITKNISNYILYHHERFDGTGYPSGLAGRAIPLYSRIIAIADSFEAMLARRPYKREMSLDEAIDELIRCSGSQFDPELVDVFVKYYQSTPNKSAHKVYKNLISY